MCWISLLMLAATVSLPAPPADEKGRSITFKKEDVGKLPTGWTPAKTGQGEGSIWQVVADASAPSKTGYVLAQLAEGPKPLFNLCILNDSGFQDGTISVYFKAVQGKVDQGGGLVWRYQDANNYYITRMNPLEDNFRVYKVVDGKRIQLATKEDIPVKPGTWHTLRIKHVGDQIEGYLDDKKLLEAKDDTFKKAGKIGLWTKADAQTYFDQLTIQPAAK